MNTNKHPKIVINRWLMQINVNVKKRKNRKSQIVNRKCQGSPFFILNSQFIIRYTYVSYLLYHIACCISRQFQKNLHETKLVLRREYCVLCAVKAFKDSRFSEGKANWMSAHQRFALIRLRPFPYRGDWGRMLLNWFWQGSHTVVNYLQDQGNLNWHFRLWCKDDWTERHRVWEKKTLLLSESLIKMLLSPSARNAKTTRKFANFHWLFISTLSKFFSWIRNAATASNAIW